jgi:TRAP-type mannitol/chloroaromatic compound transport system permease small subunit
MSSLIKPFISGLDSFCGAIGRTVSWLTLVMAVITVIVVVLRYGFSTGSIVLQESITYMHACVFLLAAAYTLQRDAHVRVDIFYRSFSSRQKAWVNAVGGVLFLLPLCGFIIFVSWNFASTSWAIFEGSPHANGIPATFLLKSLIPSMGILLALQGIAETLKSLIILMKADHNAN